MINIYEKNFRTWLDKYFDFFPKQKPTIVSFLSGLAIYLFGLIISIIGNFTWLYIKTYQLYLVILGIIWVAYWIRWGNQEFFRILKIYPFSFNNSEKEKIVNALIDKLKLATNNRLIIIVSFILTFSFYIGIISFWFLKIKFLGSKFYIPPFISEEWFIGEFLFLKAFIILLLSAFVGILIGTSGTQIVIYNFDILYFLSKHFNSGPTFVLTKKLKSITRLNLRTAYAWFVGVALVAITFYKSLTLLAFSYIVIFIILGFIHFFIPEIIFHSVLEEKKVKLLKEIGKKLEKLFDKLKDDFEIIEMEKIHYISNLSSIYKSIENSSTWIMDFSILSKLVASSITPIVAVLIKTLIIRL